MPGSGGQPGGIKGIQHVRGECPKCHREVAGGVDRGDGTVWLRLHVSEPGVPCEPYPGGRWAASNRAEMLAVAEQMRTEITG